MSSLPPYSLLFLASASWFFAVVTFLSLFLACVLTVVGLGEWVRFSSVPLLRCRSPPAESCFGVQGLARRYGSDNEAKIHGFGFGAQLIFSNRLEKPGELL